jgi:hypothetical protein
MPIPSNNNNTTRRHLVHAKLMQIVIQHQIPRFVTQMATMGSGIVSNATKTQYVKGRHPTYIAME